MKRLEYDQNWMKESQTKNQSILLNPSNLQNQLHPNLDTRQSQNLTQCTSKERDKADKMTEEPMTLSDYLNAISKTITEKKLIQKVLPTKFSREFFGANANEPITALTPEDNGSY